MGDGNLANDHDQEEGLRGDGAWVVEPRMRNVQSRRDFPRVLEQVGGRSRTSWGVLVGLVGQHGEDKQVFQAQQGHKQNMRLFEKVSSLSAFDSRTMSDSWASRSRQSRVAVFTHEGSEVFITYVDSESWRRRRPWAASWAGIGRNVTGI